MLPMNKNATATVVIKGLGLCRNMGDRWEVLFLHPKDSNHNLDIKVITRNKSNPTPETQVVAEDATGIAATVLAEGAKPITSLAHTNKNWADTEDFCWIMDLDELNEEPIELQGSPDVEFSYVTIYNAMFYTAEITPEIYRISVEGNPIVDREIGKAIGGDIECETGGAIKFDLLGRDLPQADGVRYEIVFDNNCEDCPPGEEDFHYYNEIIANSRGHIDITKVSAPLMKKKNDEAACNPPQGGGGSKRSFEEIYQSSLQAVGEDSQ